MGTDPDTPKHEPSKPSDDKAEGRMTFGEHLEELRSRILKSLLVLMGALFACMAYYQELVWFITRPHVEAMTQLGVKNYELMPGSYGGPIMAIMKLAFIISLFVSSPFIGYQVWAFVSAGLYRNERKYVLGFAPASFALFTLGCVFGYVKLIPLALWGLAKATSFDVQIVSNQYLFQDYLSLVMTLTIVLGAVFQLPLVMVFLTMVGIVEPKFWNRWRRAAMVVNVVFAAIVTPADIFTMIMVAVPMLGLYELGVLFSYLLGRRSPAPPTT
jgi:sec-independent protein translocase protein TatC